MHPILTLGTKLVEQVVTALPVAQAIGVVHATARRRKVVEGSVGIARQFFAGRTEGGHALVGLEGLQLLFQCVRILRAAQWLNLHVTHGIARFLADSSSRPVPPIQEWLSTVCRSDCECQRNGLSISNSKCSQEGVVLNLQYLYLDTS